MRQVRKDGDKETLAPKMKKDDRKKKGMPAVFSVGWTPPPPRETDTSLWIFLSHGLIHPTLDVDTISYRGCKTSSTI